MWKSINDVAEVRRDRDKAFTLIELLIVVAVISILAAIALPSYQESVARSRRASVQAVLLEASQWMERYFTQNNDYNVTATVFATSGLQFSPRGSNATNAYYTVALDPPVSPFQTFTITATRTSNGMANDRCGDFVINSVGQRTQLNNTGGVDCWAH